MHGRSFLDQLQEVGYCLHSPSWPLMSSMLDPSTKEDPVAAPKDEKESYATLTLKQKHTWDTCWFCALQFLLYPLQTAGFLVSGLLTLKYWRQLPIFRGAVSELSQPLTEICDLTARRTKRCYSTRPHLFSLHYFTFILERSFASDIRPDTSMNSIDSKTKPLASTIFRANLRDVVSDNPQTRKCY